MKKETELFHSNLLRIIKEKSINQAALARRADVKYGYLNAFVNGSGKFGIKSQVKIANALGFDHDDMIVDNMVSDLNLVNDKEEDLNQKDWLEFLYKENIRLAAENALLKDRVSRLEAELAESRPPQNGEANGRKTGQ